MKRVLLFFAITGHCFLSGTQAQTLLFEDFESGWPEGFELINVDQLVPNDPDLVGLADSAWSVRYITQEGWNSNTAFSVSWYVDDEGPSDDWMILPAVDLGDNTVLSWVAQAITSSGDFRDRYQVAISTGGPEIEDFEQNPLLFDTGQLGEIDSIKYRSVNLADAGYANQTVYIAFRNFTAPFDPNLPQGPGNGGNELMIDDILIENVTTSTEEVATEALGMSLTPNPATDGVNLSYQLDRGTKVQIEVRDKAGRLLLFQDLGQRAAGRQDAFVETGSLVTGTYVLSLRTDKQIGTLRLIVR